MSYFVWYKTAEYEGISTKRFESITTTEDFLNELAGNPEFWFQVICGHEVKFKPVEIATKYVMSHTV